MSGCGYADPGSGKDEARGSRRAARALSNPRPRSPFSRQRNPPPMQASEAARAGIWLTVEFYVKPDKVAEAEALFRRHVADGRRDRGNLMFTMLRDPEDPTHFTSLECWAEREDVAHHDAQPHHPVFLGELAEIQAREKEVRFLEFFAEGTPA